MNDIIMISKNIEKKFNDFMSGGRILLFEAPCGFGKTTLARALIKNFGAKAFEIYANETDFNIDFEKDSFDVLMVEDIHNIRGTAEYQNLCSLVRNYPDKRFVFTTRGAISGELIPFRIAGLLDEINENDMFFDKPLVSDFFSSNNILLSETELNSVMKETMGYPLALKFLAEKMSHGTPYGKKLLEEIKYDIFKYYDEMIFCRFSLPVRRFLLELAPFESFQTELAKMVSGDANAGKIIANIQKKTRMLRFDGGDEMHFWPIFREFLMWEQSRFYSAEEQRALCSRGGLYYELRCDYANALKFYSQSKEINKISEIIIKITTLHPGMGHYEELEDYYLSLPDAVIEKSPALMQGKSMLCALRGDYESSEKWYGALKNFAEVRKNSDAAAEEAKSRLIWLDISLPQRGVLGIADTIMLAFKLIKNKELKLMPFSVTSTLPSIMNGGKDFSRWSKKDDLLYATMKTPVESVLGKDGVCLADCAIAESKFEKGENISERLLSLVSKLSDIQSNGTPDIEFALVGLLVRNRVEIGKAQDAKHTLLSLRERFMQKGYMRFMPNIDAMLCRIALRCGDEDYIDRWYRDEAPRDALNIKVLKRYRYFTEAMVNLSLGEEDAALLTLSPLASYCEICKRHIDTIHLKTLCAIARFRKDDILWKEDLKSAIAVAKEYGFVRTISSYGSAVLMMLEKIYEEKKSQFLQKVIKNARAQAVFYPDFLKPKRSYFEKLTDSELQVLRLLCKDKSNAEIGDILNIQLATVKSHVSHILQKLGVKRRSEAKTTAEKLHIYKAVCIKIQFLAHGC